MSDSTNFSFPHRTPVFTALIVIVCFAAFAWLARKVYTPHAYTVQAIEGVRTPDDRRKILQDLRNKVSTESARYGWIDQKAGIVQLPIERAIELTARDLAKK